MDRTSRFLDALSGRSPRVEDRLVLKGRHVVAMPTLGMIVPNWFLLVPFDHTVNFAQQPTQAKAELHSLTTALCDSVDLGKDYDVLLFEHGAQASGTEVGCGVDHAHLHVVIAARLFIDAVWDAMKSELEAQQVRVSLDDLYGSINPSEPYYLAWCRDRLLQEQPARKEVSQRFRRIIATEAGVPDLWNYREFPFHENIERTSFNLQSRLVRAA